MFQPTYPDYSFSTWNLVILCWINFLLSLTCHKILSYSQMKWLSVGSVTILTYLMRASGFTDVVNESQTHRGSCWRGGGLCPPTQLRSGLPLCGNIPDVSSVSSHSLFFITGRFLFSTTDDYGVLKEGTAVTLDVTAKINKQKAFKKRRSGWSFVCSKQPVMIDYFQRCSHGRTPPLVTWKLFLRKSSPSLSLRGWTKFWDKAVATRLRPTLYLVSLTEGTAAFIWLCFTEAIKTPTFKRILRVVASRLVFLLMLVVEKAILRVSVSYCTCYMSRCWFLVRGQLI